MGGVDPTRSRIMSKIRSKDTKPELAVRASLDRLSAGYRTHAAELPGTPDVVLLDRKVAIFVHGCFWHGHPPHAKVPKTRAEFWQAKVATNRQRDAKAHRSLSIAGWRVLTIWECWTKDPDHLDGLLSGLLGVDPPT